MGQDKKTTLEIIGASVEEAVADGLNQLGLPAESVEVEVLDSGSKGLFGLGGRLARVRLTIKKEKPSTDAEKPSPVVKNTVIEKAKKTPIEAKPLTEDHKHELEVAKVVVEGLLEKMKILARVDVHIAEPKDEQDEAMVMVDILGDDLSILIGRRAETLSALQYITSLIVSKELDHWVPILIDIQGYRARRERQLHQLALRMAEQAIQTGKRQVLEPMPASERRMIHLALRDHEQVFSESIGEEPNRKVTITPKH